MEHRAFRSAVLSGCLSLSTCAAAQTGDSPPSERGERVEVTGSLLRSTSGETALPITVIRAEDLAKAGATSIEQAVQFITQNQSTTVSNTSIGAGTGGAAYANLRSLGSQRTLVLLNGKRLVNSPYQSLGVDLNSVPLALIDRVEVLSDGASATYGSDAIAGVINFITKREVQGITATASGTEPQPKGRGETYLGSVSGGLGSLSNDGWNVFAGFTYRKQEALLASDRGFASTTFLPARGFNKLNATTFPSNYSQTASGINSVNPTNPGCQPPFSIYGNGVFGARSCGYDFAPLLEAIPEQTLKSGLVKGTIAFAGQTASLEYTRSDSNLDSLISESPVSGLTLTSANPYYPGQGITPGATGLNPALPISLNWRTTEAGPRDTQFKNTTDRALGKIEGTIAGWDYELYGLRSTGTVHVVFTDGYVSLARIRAGLAGTGGAPFLNPFGPQTPAGRSYLLDSRILGEVQKARGELDQGGAQVSRDLFNLPAGPVALAIETDYKKEKAAFTNNFPLISQAIGSGLDLSQDARGQRHSESIGAEATIPVISKLDIGLSVRADRYSDVGSTVNPKVSFRYQPVEPVLLRGSFNTGFRAPTLYDIVAPNTLVLSGGKYNDPVLCPGGVLNTAAGGVGTRDCNIQFEKQTGGSSTLEPEKSKSFTAGFVLQPTKSFSFGADYWDYHLRKAIGGLAEAAIFGDPVKYSSLYVRCSQVSGSGRATIPGCIIPGGDALAYVVNTTQNLGDVRTTGIDFMAQWQSDATATGRYGLTYRSTYVNKYQFQREPGGPYFNKNGVYFDGNPIIRYSHFAALNWTYTSWGLQVNNRYLSGYADCNAQCSITPAFYNRVGSYTLWGLAATYSGIKHVTIVAGITNLFNVDPPFTNKNTGTENGYDERYADPTGRSFLLKATVSF